MIAMRVHVTNGSLTVLGGLCDLDSVMRVREVEHMIYADLPPDLMHHWDALAMMWHSDGSTSTYLVVGHADVAALVGVA